MDETLDGIEQSVRDFTGAEAELAEAQQRRDRTRQIVLEQVERLRSEVDAVHSPELIAVIRHLYWQQPGIHGRPLAEAADLHLNDMLAAIGPSPSDGGRAADAGERGDRFAALSTDDASAASLAPLLGKARARADRVHTHPSVGGQWKGQGGQAHALLPGPPTAPLRAPASVGDLPMGFWHASQVTMGIASRSRRRAR
ncbi:hypothetical protein [Streptomyces sp. NRRL S-118]|uniref:hypothetical protein n=1 Tax=Streptomyces sp. NRRL S-118 TaxID=1463881 RepID=UPI001F34FBF4|nr:hypothetical protein [Streptomyces sp. NRRL S-118]